MKIQIKATVNKLFIDGEEYEIKSSQKVKLEFSAIDTGGGFHDPILDLIYSIELMGREQLAGGKHKIVLYISGSNKKEQSIKLKYSGKLRISGSVVRGNGRIYAEHISDTIIAFIINNK